MYEGIIEVRGSDGTLWDATPGKLEATGDDSEPFIGTLEVEPASGIAGWSGPVILAIPGGGRARAILRPGATSGDMKLVDVTGTEAPPWT